MLFHLGDEREMATSIKEFRQQLGPGSFRSPMFLAFLKQLAVDACRRKSRASARPRLP